MPAAKPKPTAKPKSEWKREISAGGVIFHKSDEGTKVLLIKDYTGKWSLPKGLVGDEIKGETTEQAALRECAEETGLPESKLHIIEKLGDIKFSYTFKWEKSRHPGIKKGDKIFKIVTIYLIESKATKLKHQWEVQDAQWFSPDEAYEKIGYKDTKDIMKKAIEKVRHLS